MVQSKLKLFYSNVRSLNNKINELQITVNCYNYDIILLNETWLNDSTNDAMILSDYILFRNDRKSRGGGTMIAVKSNMKCSRYPITLSKNDIEFTAVMILTDVKILLICLYIPPSKVNVDIIDEVEQIANHNTSKFDHVLIVGDFNIDYFNDMDNISSEVNSIFAIAGYDQLVEQCTRELSGKTIDLCFTKSSQHVEVEIVDNISSTCDHYAMSIEMDRKKDSMLPLSPPKFKYTDVGMEKFKTRMNSINWDDLIQQNDIETSFEMYTEICSTIIQECFSINISYPSKTIPKHITKLILKKRRLHRINRKERDNSITEQILALNDQIKILLSDMKTNEINDMIRKYPNLNALFKYVKRMKKQNVSNIIVKDGVTISDNRDIAETLAEHFCSVYNRCDSDIPHLHIREYVHTDSIEICELINKMVTTSLVDIA